MGGTSRARCGVDGRAGLGRNSRFDELFQSQQVALPDPAQHQSTANQRTGGPGLAGMPPIPAFDIPGLEAFVRSRAASITAQLEAMLP